MAFYTSDDLLLRRFKIGQWILNRIDDLKNHFYYGELMCCEDLTDLEYVNACFEAIKCYKPITTATQDGINNCLKESQLDSIFNNISEITGIYFPDKETTFNTNIPLPLTIDVVLPDGNILATSNGEDIIIG